MPKSWQDPEFRAKVCAETIQMIDGLSDRRKKNFLLSMKDHPSMYGERRVWSEKHNKLFIFNDHPKNMRAEILKALRNLTGKVDPPSDDLER